MWFEKIEVSRRRLLIALAGGTFSSATLASFPRAASAAALRTLGTASFSAAKTGLGLPKGIAVDSGGNYYVAESLNNQVSVFNSSGTLQYTIPVTNAWGVAVDGSGG